MSSTTTTVLTTINEETEPKKVNKPDFIPLTVVRILLVCLAYVIYINTEVIQTYINILWGWLRHQWWFECVYFETFLVQVYSFPAMFPYRLIHTTGIGKKFK